MASVCHLRLTHWKNTTEKKHLKVKFTKLTHFVKNVIILKKKKKGKKPHQKM